MPIALLTVRLGLVVVFGVAGLAKAFDLDGSRRGLVGFGVPIRLATPLAYGLPAVEILVALALVPLATAWWGAVGALALLLIFAGGIGLNLARGRSPECRCFGQLHSAPVSWATMARNLVLAAGAGFVVVQGSHDPGLSALGWWSGLGAAEAATLSLGAALVGLLAFTIIVLNRVLAQQARLLEGMEAIRATLGDEGNPSVSREDVSLPAEGLPVGAMAPKFSLATIDGADLSLGELLARGKSVMLLFVSSNCWGCTLLLPVVRAWQRDYADRLTVAVLATGTLAENQAKMAKYEVSRLLLDRKSAVADKYQAKWTPAAVLIGPDGRIASPVTYGDDAIRELVRNLLASGDLGSAANASGSNGHVPQVALRYSVRAIGEPAPRFSLPDMSGTLVTVDDLLGSPTLLFFCHPHCQFCRAMRDDLRRWEEQPPAGAPKLVRIACGDEAEIKTAYTGLASPTLLDPAFDLAKLFGTKVTPSAIVIDAEGKVASGLAMGEPNVRALIGLPTVDQEEHVKR